MARKQKNIILDDDLCELLQAYADTTGSTFTRVMTAAALQFLFRNPCKPDRDWMIFAVAVEKSELAISDVPFEYLESRIESQEKTLKNADRLKQFVGGPAVRLVEQHELKELRAKLRVLLHALGDDDRLAFSLGRVKELAGVDDYIDVAEVALEPWEKLAKLESK